MKLVKAVTLNEDVLDFVLVLLDNIHSDRIERRTCGVNVKVIVAVNSGDFLDDVRLDGNVLCSSPRGNYNVEVVAVELSLKAEACEGFEDGVVVNLNSRIAVNKRLVKAQLNRVVLVSVLVGEG